MRVPTSYIHVRHLIGQLRSAALENDAAAMEHEHGLGLCLGAALANDAADALEEFLRSSFANDLGDRLPGRDATTDRHI